MSKASEWVDKIKEPSPSFVLVGPGVIAKADSAGWLEPVNMASLSPQQALRYAAWIQDTFADDGAAWCPMCEKEFRP